MLTLVLGGVRSGKSMLAEAAADRLARAEGLSVTYVATARASDAEMAERIRRHQERRPVGWATVEAGDLDPDALVAAVERVGPKAGVLLLDCLSLWVATVLGSGDEAAFGHRVARLTRAVASGPRHAVVVSLEAGMGLLPLQADARRFLDRLGDLNQAFGKAADRVAFCAAGLPLALKGGGLP